MTRTTVIRPARKAVSVTHRARPAGRTAERHRFCTPVVREVPRPRGRDLAGW